MSRIVITATGLGYKKGDVIEASAALVAALGSAARAAIARDLSGESVGVSNSSA